jgi:Domain of unknown function (DUF4352)
MTHPPRPGRTRTHHHARPVKRKKWPWIVGAVVVVLALGSLGSFVLVGAEAKPIAETPAVIQKSADARGLGKTTTDGKFQFTVTGMQCGFPSVGPDGFGQKAQGQFCLIDTQIKNIGRTAEIFNDTSQKAYDAAGVEYSVDSGAAFFANQDYSTFLEQINPGNTVHGKLVFDVPPGTKLESVVLHESLFTAGVKVPLM